MDAHLYHHTPVTRVSKRRSGFTITELLVVIGIIVLLAGLLLVALGRVRASSLKTSTVATMQSFGRACDAFQAEHGQYPGVIPESVLAKASGSGDTSLSSTENALLHLMGGYRVCPPGTSGCGAMSSDTEGPVARDYNEFSETDLLTFGSGSSEWFLKIDINRIGEGPVINGKPYAPYFTPGPREVAVTQGQVTPNTASPVASTITTLRLPDLIDAWGQPILYTRRLRSTGPLVGPHDATGTNRPQFHIEGMYPYLFSSQLGERSISQVNQSMLALLNDPPSTANNRYAAFAQIMRHPALGRWDISPLDDDNRGRVAPRGEYVLISAGPDGVFFSRNDGPGTSANPVINIVTGDFASPQAVTSYDDIVIFGGG